VAAELSRADRQTHMTKLIPPFGNSAKAPKNVKAYTQKISRCQFAGNQISTFHHPSRNTDVPFVLGFCLRDFSCIQVCTVHLFKTFKTFIAAHNLGLFKNVVSPLG
jgi:hypothetical protein